MSGTARSRRRARAVAAGSLRSRVGGALPRGARGVLGPRQVGSVSTETSVVYPNTALAQVLRDAAALVKADIGVRRRDVYAAAWDTHSRQKTRLAERAEDLARSVAAFHVDLGAHADRTVLLGMTEFGRSAAENGRAAPSTAMEGSCYASAAAWREVASAAQQLWPGLRAGESPRGARPPRHDGFPRRLRRGCSSATSGLNDPRPILPGHAVHRSRYPVCSRESPDSYSEPAELVLGRIACAGIGFALLCAAATASFAGADPLVIAHRGASAERPEHTLAAYEPRSSRAPTSSSPTSSRRRTECWSRATRTRSPPPPTWRVIPSSRRGARRSRSMA